MATNEYVFFCLTQNYLTMYCLGNKWKDPAACRKVFDAFAAQEGKNPLDPDTWYTLRLKKLLKHKVRKRRVC